MSEVVQALELQIRDNAEQASSGLEKLAASLRAIKQNVTGGLGLTNAANQLEKFTAKVKTFSSQENIESVNRLTKAIARLVTNSKALKDLGLDLSHVMRQAKQIEDATPQFHSTYDIDGKRTRRQGRHTKEFFASINEENTRRAAAAAEAAANVTKISEAVENIPTVTIDVDDSTLTGLTEKMETVTEAAGEMSAALAETEKVAEHVPSAYARLRGAASELFSAGLINAKEMRSAYEEIEHMDLGFDYGAHGSPDMEEAKEAVLGMVSGYREAAKAAEELRAKEAEIAHESALEEAAKDIEYAISKIGSVEELTAKIENLKSALADKMVSGKIEDGSATYFREIAAIGKLITKRDELIAKIEEEKRAKEEEEAKALEPLIGSTEAVMSKAAAGELAQRFIDGKMGVAAMKEELAQAAQRSAELRAELSAGLRAGTIGAIEAQKMGQEIAALDDRVKELTHETSLWTRMWNGADAAIEKVTGAITKGFQKVKGALFEANGSLAGMLAGMMRMAKYRIFRSLIRNIAEGFSTGLDNVRKYSKAIDGLYNKDMTGLDNELLKMKNSLGAAVAPAIQALIPLFRQLTSWVIQASNYVNQFFALINGSKTWTHAIDVEADALDEVEESAAGAHKSVQNLLADFDELNIIQSKSGGGGGGTTTEDLTQYENMFEEVSEFDAGVKGIITWLEQHLPIVDGALALLASRLMGLSLPASVMLAGIVWSYDEGKDAAKAGKSLKESIIEGLPATLLTALGGAGIGFMLAPPGMKLHGAAVGFFLGAAISIFANWVGFDQASNPVKWDSMFGNNLWDTLGSISGLIALGVTAGAILGGGTGAMIGLTLSAMLGIYLTSVKYDKHGGAIDYSSYTFEEMLADNVGSVIGFAGAGAVIGVRATGSFTGGLLGLVIGAGLGIAVMKITYDQQRSANFRKMVDTFKAQMRETFGKEHYGFDVQAFVDEITVVSNSLKSKKGDVQTQVMALVGKTEIALRVGVDTLTADEKESIVSDIETIIGQIEEQLGLEKKMIDLAVGIGGYNLFGLDKDGSIIKDLNDGIGIRTDIIKTIGNTIGKALREGTAEEFAKVLEDVTGILQTMAMMEMQSKVSSEYTTSVAKAERDLFEGEMTPEKIAAYIETHNELVEGVRDSAYSSYQSVLGTAQYNLSVLEDVLANPEKYEAQGYDTSGITQEVVDRARETLEQIQSSEWRDNYIEGFVSAIIGDDTLFSDNMLKAVEELIRNKTGVTPDMSDASWRSLASSYLFAMLAYNNADGMTSAYHVEPKIKLNDQGGYELDWAENNGGPLSGQIYARFWDNLTNGGKNVTSEYWTILDAASAFNSQYLTPAAQRRGARASEEQRAVEQAAIDAVKAMVSERLPAKLDSWVGLVPVLEEQQLTSGVAFGSELMPKVVEESLAIHQILYDLLDAGIITESQRSALEREYFGQNLTTNDEIIKYFRDLFNQNYTQSPVEAVEETAEAMADATEAVEEFAAVTEETRQAIENSDLAKQAEEMAASASSTWYNDAVRQAGLAEFLVAHGGSSIVGPEFVNFSGQDIGKALAHAAGLEFEQFIPGGQLGVNDSIGEVYMLFRDLESDVKYVIKWSEDTLPEIKSMLDNDGVLDSGSEVFRVLPSGDGGLKGGIDIVQYLMGAAGFGRSGGGTNPFGTVSGSATVGMAGGSNYGIINVNKTPTAPGVNEGDDTDGTGRENSNELLQNIVAGINRLVNKEWTVEVRPSTKMGKVMAESKQMYEKTAGVYG